MDSRFDQIEREAEEKRLALRDEILREKAAAFRAARERGDVDHVMVAVPRLTDRQKEVIRRVAVGDMSRKQMAEIFPTEMAPLSELSEEGELIGIVMLCCGLNEIEYQLTRLGEAVFEQLVADDMVRNESKW